MFSWSYLPVLKVLALYCNVCNQVLQFKLGNKLHLCNRFSESCAFGYGWTSSGKPYCSSLKILVSGLLCLCQRLLPTLQSCGAERERPVLSRCWSVAACAGHVGTVARNGWSRHGELWAGRAVLCCAGGTRGVPAPGGEWQHLKCCCCLVGGYLFKSLVIPVCPLLL